MFVFYYVNIDWAKDVTNDFKLTLMFESTLKILLKDKYSTIKTKNCYGNIQF